MLVTVLKVVTGTIDASCGTAVILTKKVLQLMSVIRLRLPNLDY